MAGWGALSGALQGLGNLGNDIQGGQDIAQQRKIQQQAQQLQMLNSQMELDRMKQQQQQWQAEWPLQQQALQQNIAQGQALADIRQNPTAWATAHGYPTDPQSIQTMTASAWGMPAPKQLTLPEEEGALLQKYAATNDALKKALTLGASAEDVKAGLGALQDFAASISTRAPSEFDQKVALAKQALGPNATPQQIFDAVFPKTARNAEIKPFTVPSGPFKGQQWDFELAPQGTQVPTDPSKPAPFTDPGGGGTWTPVGLTTGSANEQQLNPQDLSALAQVNREHPDLQLTATKENAAYALQILADEKKGLAAPVSKEAIKEVDEKEKNVQRLAIDYNNKVAAISKTKPFGILQGLWQGDVIGRQDPVDLATTAALQAQNLLQQNAADFVASAQKAGITPSPVYSQWPYGGSPPKPGQNPLPTATPAPSVSGGGPGGVNPNAPVKVDVPGAGAGGKGFRFDPKQNNAIANEDTARDEGIDVDNEPEPGAPPSLTTEEFKSLPREAGTPQSVIKPPPGWDKAVRMKNGAIYGLRSGRWAKLSEATNAR